MLQLQRLRLHRPVCVLSKRNNKIDTAQTTYHTEHTYLVASPSTAAAALQVYVYSETRSVAHPPALEHCDRAVRCAQTTPTPPPPPFLPSFLSSPPVRSRASRPAPIPAYPPPV